jgi:hypothetical protein
MIIVNPLFYPSRVVVSFTVFAGVAVFVDVAAERVRAPLSEPERPVTAPHVFPADIFSAKVPV